MTNDSIEPPFFPVPVDVEAGKTYYWCGCKHSTTQPLCDKVGQCDKSVKFQAILTETVYLCACKTTQDPPYCDGSHAKLLLEIIKKRKRQEDLNNKDVE